VSLHAEDRKLYEEYQASMMLIKQLMQEEDQKLAKQE